MVALELLEIGRVVGAARVEGAVYGRTEEGFRRRLSEIFAVY